VPAFGHLVKCVVQMAVTNVQQDVQVHAECCTASIRVFIGMAMFRYTPTDCILHSVTIKFPTDTIAVTLLMPYIGDERD
jgi:hypothetical protein